jgi:hypothetical protein
MGLSGSKLTEYREKEIERSTRRLEHLEKHGASSTDAARTERSNIRWQAKQLAAEAADKRP